MEYTFTRRVDKKTGQLPDTVILVITTADAWRIFKEITMQIERKQEPVTLCLHGTLDRDEHQ